MGTFSRQATLRLAVNTLAPLDTIRHSTLPDDDGIQQRGDSRRRNRSNYQASLTLKF